MTLLRADRLTIARPHPGEGVRQWSLIAVAYLLGSLAFLWPMPAQLSTGIWGDRFDAWTTLWLIGHIADGLEAGTLTADTTAILYPIGYNLWSFGHMALQAIGSLMVWAGLGTITAYNCLLIGSIWTSGIAAHMLGREITGSHVAGGVAGIVFCTSPYMYAEGAAGCIELVAAGLIPLHAWALVRLAREPTWGRCALATGILALVGPFNWYYTLFTGVFGLGFVGLLIGSAWKKLREPSRTRHRRSLILILLSMVLAGALNLPLIDAARKETPTRPALSAELFMDESAWTRSQSLSDGTAPIAELSNERIEEVDALQVLLNSTSVLHLIEGRFSVNPLGITPGNLAYSIGFIGLLVGGRRTWGWMGLAVGFTVLTLGPFLMLEPSPGLAAGETYTTLPYAWAYTSVPFFSKAYRPYRFAVVVLQCLAVIGAIGAAVLVRHLGPRRVAAGVGLLALVGFSQPHWSGDKPALRRVLNAQPDPLYEQLLTAPSGAVIEVPLQYQPVSIATARQQTFQLAHKHPVLNTNQLIRRPDLMAFRNYVLSNTMLQTFVDLGRRAPPLSIEDSDIISLKEQGFRYIVVHDRIPVDDQQLAGEREWADMVVEPARTMLDTVLGAPAFQTQEGRIYDLDRAKLTVDRIRTWTDDNITQVDSPFDTVRTGQSLYLRAGNGLEVYSGTAKRFSLWVQPVDPDTGPVRLEVRAEEETKHYPLNLETHHWTFSSIDIDLQGPLQLRLQAGNKDTAIALTRMQVVQ
jgi:hypothetical protein